ncbi:MAG TPA: ThiF family adenylyltransferase [Trebonia sp.]|nr:ThiF family adenylyltransferase [Trebonia sp.]
MDKYARQRGLVIQDVLADAEIALHGTGSALPYVLQCLVMAGVATRHGAIRLHLADRPVTEADIAGQFLLTHDDLGEPLAGALASRVTLLDEAVDIGVGAGPARGLSIAVPAAAEITAIEASGDQVAAWGQPLGTSVYVGPAPLRLAADPPGTVLSASLAAVCGGLLAQVVLRQVGAIIAGPAVLTSWFEEHLWLAHPGIGAAATAAIEQGTPWPALLGVLDRISADAAQRFQILVEGMPASPEPRVTTVLSDDAVVVAVRRERLGAPPAVIRPARAPMPLVEPLLWSPVEGPELQLDTAAGDDDWPPGAIAEASVVVCGAGALGSWATAVLAASRIPGLRLSLVDMDDAVEAHNLNRQVLFGGADIGLPKARRAVERLMAIDPGLDARPLQVQITPVLARELASGEGPPVVVAEATPELDGYRTSVAALRQQLQTATAVLSCPDNHQTRWSLNLLTESLGIPLIDGAIAGFLGRLHVCDPADQGQCLVCWLGTSIASDAKRHSCTDLVGDEPIPAIVTSAAVIGAAQAAALICVLSGAGGRIRRYHGFDGTGTLLAGYRGGDRDHGECPTHLLGPPAAAQRPSAHSVTEGQV